MRKWIVVSVLAIGTFVAGTAFGTPSSGVSAVTVRGNVVSPIKLKEQFANGGAVKIKVTGPMEFVVQRIEALPGATFGWHSHPGENINVVQQGTLTFYHDENCTAGINYGPGAVFTSSPDQIHLARNESTTETLVLFATYFVPKTTPLQPIRIDQPSPGPSCPL
jgi:quercetin dioxygenase-like cupin family protein